MVSPSMTYQYWYEPGWSGSEVYDQTPLSSLAMSWVLAVKSPCTCTALALGACRRKVTLRSAPTSGDRTPRPWAWAWPHGPRRMTVMAAVVAVRDRWAMGRFLVWGRRSTVGRPSHTDRG